MISIIGHFGSTLSYATVASRVARAFLKAGILASVTNLDDKWVSAHEDLAAVGKGGAQGSHVIVFSIARHYFDAFTVKCGRDRSAIFMSPNTDRLVGEYAETCSLFGTALVPSTWCEDVVYRSAKPGEVVRLPLGVDEKYLSVRSRVSPGPPGDVWHFTTDHWLPGRKGTEELMEAWRVLVKKGWLPAGAKLHVHAPLALASRVQYMIADSKMSKHIVLETPNARGSSDEELVQHFRDAALIVQPSRCEGFGMMMLAALAAGVPLVTTAITGHRDYLATMPGWLGVATGGMTRLESEGGEAPFIDGEALSTAIAMACTNDGYALLQRGARASESAAMKWTWEPVLDLWVEWAQQWIKETT